MNYKKLINTALNNNRDSGMMAVAVIAGLAAGAALSVLFAPESGRETRERLGKLTGLTGLFSADPKKAAEYNEDLVSARTVEDLREKTREHADHLQGPEKKRKNASLIKVPSAGTDAWKKHGLEE